MGSPLSLIISKIFLQYLEVQHIESLKAKFNILYYGRYVDGILIIYDTNKDNSNEILEEFNSIHSNVKFTLEKQTKSFLISLM